MKQARRSIALLLVVLIMISACMVGLADSVQLDDLDMNTYNQMLDRSMQFAATSGADVVWGTGYTNTENVKVYSMYVASEDQFVIDTIPEKDTKVTVFARPDDGILPDTWYKIKHNDQIGYAEAKDITIIPAEEYAHVEGCDTGCTAENCACSCHMLILYEQLMACETIEEMEALVQGMADDEIDAFFASLSIEQMNAFIEKVNAVFPQNDYIPQTVSFTRAGPFLPAVNVGRSRMTKAKAADGDREDNPGVETSKTLIDHHNGTYTLRLESYVTGETTTTTTTTTTPVDIVLVLDQSGSMAYDFAGNYAYNNENRRQYAMKQAVNSFIDAVAEKYDKGTSDHRMAIVTYATNASNLRGWTYVDAAGATTLHNAINGLDDSPSGATNAGAGMKNAVDLMGSGYAYTGSNTTRQKVVIMFTDGVPTTGTAFSVSVANTALGHANTLKKSRGATVYTIGIFNGANVNQLYGDDGFYQNSNGTVGSEWYSRFNRGNVDVPAGNRFLNYLSSNFTEVEQIGLRSSDSGVGWEITANAAGEPSGYYLTAGDSAALSKIFTNISGNIQTGGASVSLTSTTVVKDVVTEYFTIPDGVSSVTVKTADCTSFEGDVPVWGKDEDEDEDLLDLTLTVDGNTVTVSGFDFSANWVGRDTNTGAVHHGKKLILEIVIKPIDGFLGGIDVPTNAKSSGIYPDGVDQPAIEEFEVPETDVQLASPEVNIPEANVFLGAHFGGSIDEAAVKLGTVITIDGKIIDPVEPYGCFSPVQAEFVEITVDITPQGGASFENIQQDIKYDIQVEVRYKGSTEPVSSANSQGTVHVFKPELTFADKDVWYGADVPMDLGYSELKWVWRNSAGNTKYSDDNDVEMLDRRDPPALGFSYTPKEGTINEDKINSKQDIPVKVNVSMDIQGVEQDITNHVEFVHTPCNPLCSWKDPTANGNPAFLLHVKTCSLTITKDGDTADEPYVFTVQKDGKAYTEASITGKGSVTIYELPVGTYSIAEDMYWSWRYTEPNSTDVCLSATNPAGELTCNNSLSNTKWLNDYSQSGPNVFVAESGN